MTEEYELAFSDPDPLVSVVIPTYTSYETLRDRAIPSVLAQTYENFEIVVIGDAAPPEAAEAVASFDDDRIVYENLSIRGPYPEDAFDQFEKQRENNREFLRDLPASAGDVPPVWFDHPGCSLPPLKSSASVPALVETNTQLPFQTAGSEKTSLGPGAGSVCSSPPVRAFTLGSRCNCNRRRIPSLPPWTA